MICSFTICKMILSNCNFLTEIIQLSLCWSGNELSGTGVGTRVAAAQYVTDTMVLQNIVQKIYTGVEPKPLIIAPGGLYDEKWFKEYIDKSKKSLDVVSRHIYNLGPGIFG